MAAVSPLIVIVGPTASGKTAMAIELAKQHNGEIICADSRTVYKGMDISTAKPTKEEQAKVPHHLIDIITPDQRFTVVDFQKRANQAIDDIHGRRKLPILVGGSGLYVDAVIYGYQFAEQGAERDRQNPRHLGPEVTVGRQSLRENTLVLGMAAEPEQLKAKIDERVASMAAHGLVEEIKRIAEAYGWDAPALQTPAFKAFKDYVQQKSDLKTALQAFARQDKQLARRQRTWFKRNPDIHWVTGLEAALVLAKNWLIESNSNGQNARMTIEK